MTKDKLDNILISISFDVTINCEIKISFNRCLRTCFNRYLLLITYIQYRSTITSFSHACTHVVPRNYYTASPLRACVHHTYS